MKGFCKELCRSEGWKVLSTEQSENPILHRRSWKDKTSPKAGKKAYTHQSNFKFIV